MTDDRPAFGETPPCAVCEEAPAEGTFWKGEPVCRACAECAIDDGHMAERDFEWWTARVTPGSRESLN